jgi:pSer/pThr/pTyr-binding forkhead associated (FHA) protein
MLVRDMAFLKQRATDAKHSLSSRYIVGRAPTSHLCLTNRMASSTHAEILWNGSTWELRDLGSRNGTFLSDRRLAIGERVTIRRGARFAFGDAKDLFELVDDGPPQAVAINDNGQRQESEDGILILPRAEHPVLTIFDEGGGTWVAESNDGSRQRISNGDTLPIEAQRWRVELPVISEGTWQPSSTQIVLRRTTMRFAVSRDEEHVEVSLIQGNQTVVLPLRAHNFLLLTLARVRSNEQGRADVTEAEAGWVYVPDLLDMLQTSDTALNVAICRARRDLARAEVFGATELIERQPATRRLRLGVQNVEILSV